MRPIAVTDGQAIAFPNVCLTPAPPGPPVPVPYPSIASLADATKVSANVTVGGKGIVLAGESEVPSTTGDEAGSNKGVTSMVIGGKCRFPQGSSTVLVNGKGVVRMGDPTEQNVGPAGPNAFGQVLGGDPSVLVGG